MTHFLNRRLVFAVAFAMLGAPGFALAEEAKVSIDNFSFTPATVKVKVGSTITFVNHDDIPHSVVASNGSFHSKALDTDDSYTFTATKVGEMPYFCGLHPHMKGKIIVVQ